MNIKNYYSYEKIKIHNVDCHIFKFETAKFNISMVGKINGSYERLSGIKPDNVNDSHILKLSVALHNDDNEYYYPSAVIWNTGKMSLIGTPPTQYIYNTPHKCIMRCNATLLINGKENIIYPTDSDSGFISYLNSKRPRTIIGQTDTHTIIIVAEGASFFNKGFNINQCLNLVKDMGCINACILSDNKNAQLLYMNEIMTKNKYEKRENPSLIVTSDTESENLAGYICNGKIKSKEYVEIYSDDGSPVYMIIPNKPVVPVCDICENGYYKIIYAGNDVYIKGTQIKLI